MNNILSVMMVGMLSGVVGTGLGGLVALAITHDMSKKRISVMMSFSAGMMLSVVCFDLIPVSIELSGIFTALCGVFAGALLVLLMDYVIANGVKGKGNSMLRMGVLMGLGIALHNFPEGLAIGSGFSLSTAYALGIALTIFLHDLPEGMAMSLPLSAGGMNGVKVVMWSIIAGIPTGIGAFVGGMLGSINTGWVSLCLASAGGAMLMITCTELIPESGRMYHGRLSGVMLVFGMVAGLVVCYMI